MTNIISFFLEKVSLYFIILYRIYIITNTEKNFIDIGFIFFSICYRKNVSHMMPREGKTCVVFLVFLSETIDLFLDWDFIYEIDKSSQHVDESTKQWIQVVWIWEVILYLFTLASLCLDCCIDDDEENPLTTFLSCLSTMTEDFPQIVLAIVVACRTTHLISWVQIAKAVYGVIEPFLRFSKISNDIDRSRQSFRTAFPCYECLKSFDMFFCFLLCACSVGLLIIFLLPAN